MQHAACVVGGEENGHHAVIGCTKATALRKELRRFMQLPDEAQFRRQGPDWFLLLLSREKEEVRANILLLLWRAWFLRNNATHDTGEATVQGSVMFLRSYCESISQEGLHPPIPKNEKGTQSVIEGQVKGRCVHDRGTQRKEHSEAWKPPPQGWIKLNTDTGFCIQTGQASMGLIVRNDKGGVLLSAWRTLARCSSLEVAEAEACLAGLRLVVEWNNQPTQVEVDCQTLVKAIKDRSESRASWAGLIEEIRGVIALLLGSQVKHVRRDANKAAHSLAQRALRSHGWVVMRLSVPEKRFVVSLKLRQQGTVLFLVPVTLFSLINIAALVHKKSNGIYIQVKKNTYLQK
jgi:ribonuclease HI